MKKIFALFLALTMTLVCFCALAEEAHPLGCMLDKMSTADLNTNPVTGEIFSQYRITYVNLWVTWCEPCKTELPNIQAMYTDETYKAMGLNVLGIFCEDDISTLKAGKDMLRDNKCTFTNVRIGSDGQLLNLVARSGDNRPVSYIVNNKGEVLSYYVGGMSKPAMKEFIDEGFRIADTQFIHENIALGDANADGSINTGDATLVLKYAANMISFDKQQCDNSDCNFDGKVNTGDATIILKHSAEIELLPAKKIFTLTVRVEGEEDAIFMIETYSGFLRAPLEDNGIIAGEEGEYGLFVKTVNGRTADAEKQEWWCLTKGGEMLETGVETTPIVDGDSFEFTLTVGW